MMALLRVRQLAGREAARTVGQQAAVMASLKVER